MLDDRDSYTPGWKFAEWELRGVPVRLEIGPKDLDAGVVTAGTRLGARSRIPRADLLDGVQETLRQLQDQLLARAEENLEVRVTCALTIDETSAAVKTGVALAPWCGSRECAEALEQQVDASVLGTEVRGYGMQGASPSCIVCGKPGSPALVGRSY